MTELLLTDIGSKVMMDQAVDSEISYNQYKSLLSVIYAYYQYLFFSSYNKHFMTGTMGNNEFCFPETLNVSWSEAERIIQVEGEENSA